MIDDVARRKVAVNRDAIRDLQEELKLLKGVIMILDRSVDPKFNKRK